MVDVVGATTATLKEAKKLVSSTVATAVSGISDAVSSVSNALGGIVSAASSTQLPLANPLHQFATYNYVLSLGVLTPAQVNDPDGTYMSGGEVRLICKTSNSDPNNRVNTAYGKTDFFIDNLVTDSVISWKKGSTNVTTLSFDIVEPYSMGIFLIAVQQAAFEAGWINYASASYLLTVEFRGNTEIGTMSSLPDSKIQIPIKITTINSKVSASGSVYTVNGVNWCGQALASKHSTFKSDISISGATVQEVLQTGEKSLQAVINKKYDELKDQGVKHPDQILILFPTDIASATVGKSNNNADPERRDRQHRSRQ